MKVEASDWISRIAFAEGESDLVKALRALDSDRKFLELLIKGLLDKIEALEEKR